MHTTTGSNFYGSFRIDRFNSMPDLFQWIRKGSFAGAGYGAWGGATESGMQKIEKGDSCMADKVNHLLEQVDARLEGRQRREYVHSPNGAFPVVADYLLGLPMNMRRRQAIESEQAPIRIIVETAVSSGINDTMLVNRGAALAALVMRLSETRAVELWTLWGTTVRGTAHVFGLVQIETAPIDIAHVATVMASKDFARAIEFSAALQQANARSQYESIEWNWGVDPTNGRRIAEIRNILELEPQDVFMPGGYLDDSQLMMNSPVEWVNKFLNSQRKVEGLA